MFSVRSCFVALSLAAAVVPAAAVTITSFNTVFAENFDSLSTTGPANGFTFLESGSASDTGYAAGTGSSATGNTYSFGATGDSDRAFGTLRSGSLASTLGAPIVNLTGGTITDLTIQYTGEQWRLGALGRLDRLDFAYSTTAGGLTGGSWTDVDALDFVAPINSGSTGALNGNLAANRITLSYTLSGLGFSSGSTLWLRWTDFDASGSDDGLGIDDFSIKAQGGTAQSQAVPEHLPAGGISVLLAALVGLTACRRRVSLG
jgi:hypothetical protein